MGRSVLDSPIAVALPSDIQGEANLTKRGNMSAFPQPDGPAMLKEGHNIRAQALRRAIEDPINDCAIMARAERIAISVDRKLKAWPSPGFGSPGYDGFAPTIEIPRDIHGKGKRTLERRVKYDTIDRLKNAHVLQKVHVDAARKLQEDANAAEIRSQSSMDGIPSTRTLYALSDAQCDSMAKHADARAAVTKALGVAGSRGELLLRLVVIENRTLVQTHAIMNGGVRGRNKIQLRSMGDLLRMALEVLARHYGYA